jgi:NADH dehydrogenase
VNQIDLPNKQVLISRGCRDHAQVHYDHLVIALGSITNFYNHPGFSELALAIKSLPDAIHLRAQIIRHLEDANSECNSTDRQSLLTFVVAGGGFAGVETVAALNDFVREALPFYPKHTGKYVAGYSSSFWPGDPARTGRKPGTIHA